MNRVSTTLPQPARDLLIKAAKTHSPEEIDAAILAVKKMYPQLFVKEL
jgi:hypothetical protein